MHEATSQEPARAEEALPEPAPKGFPESAPLFPAPEAVEPRLPVGEVALGNGASLEVARGALCLDPDMHLASRGMDVDLRFYYNSQDSYNYYGNDAYGYGRTISLNRFLEENVPSTGKVTVHLGTGRRLIYSLSGGVYNPPPGAYDQLWKGADGTWGQLRARDQVYFVYDTGKRLARIVDLNGNTQTITRDPTSSRITGLTDAAGRLITFSYDGNGRLNKVLDWGGRYQYFDYDTAATPNLKQVIGPTGCVTTYLYDASHGLTTVIDPDGYRFTYQYDAHGKVTGQTRPGGEQTYFNYTTGELTRIDALGQPTYFGYDAALGTGDVTYVKDPLGNVTTYTYGTWREIQKITDAQGRVTTYSVDTALGHGNVTIIYDPKGGITTYSYDPTFNRIKTWQDPLGKTTTYAYDAKGNLQQVTDRLGKITTYTYDAYGQRLTEKNPLLKVTSYSYDPTGYGNRIATTDPSGHITTFGYDTLGRVNAATNVVTGGATPVTLTTYYEYDALDRPTKTTDPNNHVTQYAYDGRGNRTLEIDPKGYRTTYQYDGNSRLVATINALGLTTTYDYDDEGRQLSVSDPGGNTTSFEYDALSRPVSTQSPTGQQVRHVYNRVGNLTKRTVRQL